jgi:hypothetical protein
VRDDLDQEVVEVAAHPDAPGAWLRTAEAVLHVRGDAVSNTSARPAGPLRVDDLGRLLVPAADGLDRLGVGRAVGIRGVHHGQRLANGVTLELFPSVVDEVVSLEIELDGAPLEVVDGTARLDLEGLSSLELHALTARAAWADGGTAESLPLSFGIDPIGNVTWAGDIQPLFEAECARCHGGDTDTRLDTSEAWQERIELVLLNVRSGTMPIGGQLSDAQIAAIEAWRLGGFP